MISECVDDFAVTFESNADGGWPYQQVITIEDCAMICRFNPRCVAFDFDRNYTPQQNTRCWMHWVDDSSVVVKKQSFVDHFTKRACAGMVFIIRFL